jgi:hypothetical protein
MLLAVLALERLMIAWGAEAPGEVPTGELRACATIAEDAARLACYDRLAGRAASRVAAPIAGNSPAAAGHAVTPTPVRPAAASSAVPAAPTQPQAAVSTARPNAAVAAPMPKESFGLYTAEHPTPTVATSLEAAVVALGKSQSGRMTVQLEGGALWELEDPDPLLAVGELVTITRASLGSYLMHTPSRRIHRVRRLR